MGPATRTLPPRSLPLLLLMLPLLLLPARGVSAQESSEKTKRQIFREQVTPHAGGKIPEEAFRVDRLALNRLNKDGIAVPDGVVLDARRRDKHPALRHNSDLERSIVKVLVTPESRFTSPEGRLHPQRPLTVDSTYVIRPPIGSRRRPPPAVGRPLPGPPLMIPTKGGAGAALYRPPPPHRPPQPHSQYGPAYSHSALLLHSGPATSQGFPDYINTLYPSTTFDDFEALLWQLNARAEGDAARVASAVASAAAPAPAASARGPAAAPGADGCGAGLGADLRLHADAASRCQVFHVCQHGRRDSFLCPRGTLFNEAVSHCDWWYNVKC